MSGPQRPSSDFNNVKMRRPGVAERERSGERDAAGRGGPGTPNVGANDASTPRAPPSWNNSSFNFPSSPSMSAGRNPKFFNRPMMGPHGPQRQDSWPRGHHGPRRGGDWHPVCSPGSRPRDENRTRDWGSAARRSSQRWSHDAPQGFGGPEDHGGGEWSKRPRLQLESSFAAAAENGDVQATWSGKKDEPFASPEQKKGEGSFRGRGILTQKEPRSLSRPSMVADLDLKPHYVFSGMQASSSSKDKENDSENSHREGDDDGERATKVAQERPKASGTSEDDDMSSDDDRGDTSAPQATPSPQGKRRRNGLDSSLQLGESQHRPSAKPPGTEGEDPSPEDSPPVKRIKEDPAMEPLDKQHAARGSAEEMSSGPDGTVAASRSTGLRKITIKRPSLDRQSVASAGRDSEPQRADAAVEKPAAEKPAAETPEPRTKEEDSTDLSSRGGDADKAAKPAEEDNQNNQVRQADLLSQIEKTDTVLAGLKKKIAELKGRLQERGTPAPEAPSSEASVPAGQAKPAEAGVTERPAGDELMRGQVAAGPETATTEGVKSESTEQQAALPNGDSGKMRSAAVGSTVESSQVAPPQKEDGWAVAPAAPAAPAAPMDDPETLAEIRMREAAVALFGDDILSQVDFLQKMIVEIAQDNRVRALEAERALLHLSAEKTGRLLDLSIKRRVRGTAAARVSPESFARVRPLLEGHVATKLREEHRRKMALSKKYRNMRQSWLDRLKQRENSLSEDEKLRRKEQDQYILMVTRGTTLVPSTKPGGRVTYRPGPSGALGAPVNMREVELMLNEIEKSGGTAGGQERWSRTLAQIPDQMPELPPFDGAPMLVEDPLMAYFGSRAVNPWTRGERLLFMEKYSSHPKDFRKIASFFENKDVGDAIRFYYKYKTRLNLKQSSKTGNKGGGTRMKNATNNRGRPTSNILSGFPVDSVQRRSIADNLLPEDVEIRRASKRIPVRSIEPAEQWTSVERGRFFAALRSSGLDFEIVSKLVSSRSPEECKEFYRLSRRRIGPDAYLPGVV